MDASSLTFTASPLSAPSGAAPSPALPAGEGVRGADFANLLENLISAQQRQGLAAPGTGAAGLQSVALSPNIELITADEPLPDSDSLLAFARNQGLDDATIRNLFPPTAALDAQLHAAQAAATAAAAAQALQAAQAVGAGGMLAAPLAPTAADAAQAGQAGALPAGPTLGALAALGGQALRGLDVRLGSPAGPGGAAAALLPSATQAGAQAAVLATNQAALPPAAPALQDVLRLELQPHALVAQRLAGLAATGQTVAWGQVTGQPLSETLTLAGAESLLQPDALSAADAAGGPGGGATGGQTFGGQGQALGDAARLGAGGPAQEASTAADRAAQYEQLAQRLGQALGQRLQAQIERGEWKVQMQLDPADLGRIDMELQMRSGGLDAVFRSDNQATRDLITQGLPRLRETLSQSGTAVASVWVQGDSSRQSGGNPTPDRGQHTAGRSPRDSEPELTLEPTLATPRVSRDGTAWDVLA